MHINIFRDINYRVLLQTFMYKKYIEKLLEQNLICSLLLDSQVVKIIYYLEDEKH